MNPELIDYEVEFLSFEYGSSEYYALMREAKLFFLPFGLQFEINYRSRCDRDQYTNEFFKFRFSWASSTSSDPNVKAIVDFLQSCSFPVGGCGMNSFFVSKIS
jgi:hypothetical protein